MANEKQMEVISPDELQLQENGDLITQPQMNISVPVPEEEKILITDEKYVSIFDESLEDIRQNNKEIDYYLSLFADMMGNGGDATSSTKEAVVNLLKIKSDSVDKKAKILDLATRIKLKERDTFPKFMAKQSNTYNITNKKTVISAEEKRALIENEARKMEGGV